MQGVLPTDGQMITLKKELNFLLWTTDVPEVPKDFPLLVASHETLEPAKLNIQCRGHALVAAAILVRLGYTVTTRAGRAFVLDTSPDGNPDNDFLNEIGKHWWLTVDHHGLVDLSLNAETENPLIYCNRSIGGLWMVGFSEKPEKLNPFLTARQRGCFYLTCNKQQVQSDTLSQSLTQLFASAKSCGINIPYANIVQHCERLLSDDVGSLAKLTQEEAWHRLT